MKKYPMRFTLCRAKDCTRKVAVDGNPLCTPHRKQVARGEPMTPEGVKRTSGKRGPKRRKPKGAAKDLPGRDQPTEEQT